jgi:MFS family permease
MKYYQKLTLLFALMWGFIGIQRFVISIIMPAVQSDMNFSYTDVGLIVSVTGLVWACGTVVWAGIGDRFGRRPVIVACTILASLLSWVTGFVHSLGQMLVVRGILGLFEGGPFGPAVATLSEEAPPSRRAMNIGIVTGCFMLVGLFVGPPVAVGLLEYFGSWRPVFYVISIPGIVVGIVLAFVVRESATVTEGIRMRKAGRDSVKHDKQVRLADVLKYKNVLLSTINSVPVMAWLWIYTGFTSLFLTDVHKLDLSSVGVIMSASGIGGFIGEFALGAVSDTVGRKKSLIAAALLCSVFGVSVALMPVGTSVMAFSALFFMWGFFGAGMYPMYLGTLPAEAVPPEVAGTAIAVPAAVGEVLGAALMPTLAGLLADRFSLFAPMWMAALAGLFICVVSTAYVETAPACIAKMKQKPGSEDHLLRRFRPVKQMAVARD